jgi:hypothetical protein
MSGDEAYAVRIFKTFPWNKVTLLTF